MDSLSHIYFADRLLVATKQERGAAICALLPQVDRGPAYLHRMYAHPFSQVRRILDEGLATLYDRSTSTDDSRWAGSDFQDRPALAGYVHERVLAERPRMRSFERQYEVAEGVAIAGVAVPSALSATLAYVSHTYQDVFNNPMQAFLPYSSYPCGAWDLWEELGAIEFRTHLYEPTAIEAFRSDFFSGTFWNTELEAISLIEAMVHRTAVYCVKPAMASTIGKCIASLGLGRAADQDRESAIEFLLAHETKLIDAMRQYGAARAAHAAWPVPS